MTPSPEVNELIGSVLAIAAELYDIRVHCFVVMSNHVHLLVHDRDCRLSEFMKYFKSNVARLVSAVLRWEGRFWSGRFHSAPVLDDGAALDKFRYVLAHGVKEGIVDAVGEWPGLSSTQLLLDESCRIFVDFRKGRHVLPLPSQSDPHHRYVELRMARLRQWDGDDRPCYEQKLRDVINGIHAEHAGKRRALGVAAVLQQNPREKSFKLKRSPQPLCHATDPQLRRQYLEGYREFVRAHRVASRKLRDGLEVGFPVGAFVPAHPVRDAA